MASSKFKTRSPRLQYACLPIRWQLAPSSDCTLGQKFAGTQLLNLLFLPPHATVIEYNPHGLYADYWQWAHALDLNYKYTVPDVPISDEEARGQRSTQPCWAFQI
eukprot:3484918-Amphidinium_carterae.1